MTMFENEVAADNQRRMFDRLSRSPAERAVTAVGDFVGAAAEVTQAPILGCLAHSLNIACLIRSLGVPTVEENLDYLGAATEQALSGVEHKLEAQGNRIEEIKQRLESDAFRHGIAAAVLQTQRTKQKQRLKRMALILANGVAEDDLEPEGIDDLLRAAAELKEADISLLQKLYHSQISLLNEALRSKGQAPFKWHQDIQGAWKSFIDSGGLNPQDHLSYRSSFSRLESLGLIQNINFAGSYGVGCDIYALLAEGKRFYEHSRNIEI